ncbi:uncharacterized protein LACBIDRAFT_334439 [Laccaria bicolor S238N-H82]|uniref:Predicted protein n=1 Tax=Laccaria bicolor (strain S238N-H82 / ATCC MYA-4686) TaxID=486041 RepID=B0DZ78_LACBS|nr:uncharacterized protein LACBIDRAFT_334439 [Laccaria bicolor S238N-H82]EDR00140.1 predicted protein [Laccaria bicolor S238N-H82]|eukprot:XP_001889197.1 predicted protein [Laccaria bicolor S238N-H82]
MYTCGWLCLIGLDFYSCPLWGTPFLAILGKTIPGNIPVNPTIEISRPDPGHWNGHCNKGCWDTFKTTIWQYNPGMHSSTADVKAFNEHGMRYSLSCTNPLCPKKTALLRNIDKTGCKVIIFTLEDGTCATFHYKLSCPSVYNQSLAQPQNQLKEWVFTFKLCPEDIWEGISHLAILEHYEKKGDTLTVPHGSDQKDWLADVRNFPGALPGSRLVIYSSGGQHDKIYLIAATKTNY